MDTITEKKYTTANFEGLFKLENLSDNKTKFRITGHVRNSRFGGNNESK